MVRWGSPGDRQRHVLTGSLGRVTRSPGLLCPCIWNGAARRENVQRGWMWLPRGLTGPDVPSPCHLILPGRGPCVSPGNADRDVGSDECLTWQLGVWYQVEQPGDLPRWPAPCCAKGMDVFRLLLVSFPTRAPLSFPNHQATLPPQSLGMRGAGKVLLAWYCLILCWRSPRAQLPPPHKGTFIGSLKAPTPPAHCWAFSPVIVP